MAGTNCPHCNTDLSQLIRSGAKSGLPARCPQCGRSISASAGQKSMSQGTSSLPKQSYEGGSGRGRFDRRSII